MRPFRRLFGYVVRYKGAFILGLACAIATRSITLSSPKVLQYAIDDLTLGVTRSKLLVYGSALLGIGLVGGIFRFLARRILVGASRDIEYDLRNEFFAHLEKLPLAYFQANRTGDLMSRATNDLSAVRMMIGPSAMYFADTLLTFVVSLTMMFTIDVRLALVAVVPLPFVLAIVKVFGSAIENRFERIQAQLSDISAVTQEALAGVRVVRAYRQEEAELERFRRSNAEYVRRNRKLIALQGMFYPSIGLLLGIGAMFVLWFGSREVILGRITVGHFVAFNAYMTLLTWPLIAFGWVTNTIQRGIASWKRMLAVLETEPSIADAAPVAATTTAGAAMSASGQIAARDGEGVAATGSTGSSDRQGTDARGPFEIRGEIEFRDLTFAHNGRPVLRDVSVKIPAGQTVALVGPTGSGKSTLIALLARMYDPPPATVFIDGRDVREIPLAVLRQAIGFVPQEPFLFSDTLAANVAFGLDAHAPWTAGGSTDAEALARANANGRMTRIVSAAQVARLDKDVADFPKGYDTLVGERGITLSGGQKQRAAIARAVAIDPRILVLDDALSAVDTYTEEEILTRLLRVMRERTSILVSHRISTVRRADMILVLDEGRIVDRGTHEELISRQGLYAELHQKQLLEEELAAS